MIVVHYWQDADGDTINIVGVIDDGIDIDNDIDLIVIAIHEQSDFSFTNETLYEIYLRAATIDSDPIPEQAFVVHEIIELVHDPNSTTWNKPIIRL